MSNSREGRVGPALLPQLPKGRQNEWACERAGVPAWSGIRRTHAEHVHERCQVSFVGDAISVPNAKPIIEEPERGPVGCDELVDVRQGAPPVPCERTAWQERQVGRGCVPLVVNTYLVWHRGEKLS